LDVYLTRTLIAPSFDLSHSRGPGLVDSTENGIMPTPPYRRFKPMTIEIRSTNLKGQKPWFGSWQKVCEVELGLVPVSLVTKF